MIVISVQFVWKGLVLLLLKVAVMSSASNVLSTFAQPATSVSSSQDHLDRSHALSVGME